MAISATMISHLANSATYLAHAWRVEERPRELVVHWAAASVANVKARGGYLKKNGGTDGTDDAAARSIGSFDGDFYVKFRTRLDGTVYFGLAATNDTAAASSIDYAIRVEADGTIKIYEGGALEATATTTARNGDFLRVQRVGTSITYWHNRTKVYTSATPSTGALVCDTAIVTSEATVNDAVFGYVPTVVTITDHTRRLVINGETYKPLPMIPTKTAIADGLKPNNAELTYILTSAGISEADVVGGRWDFARFEYSTVRFPVTTAALYSASSTITLATDLAQKMTGQFGEFKINTAGHFTVEFRSISQPLAQELGDIVGSLCVAPQLGGFICGLPMDDYIKTGTIDSVTNSLVFVVTLDDGTQADDFFEYGLMQFVDGENAFFEREVKNNVGDTLTLQRPFPFVPQVGDAVRVLAGCNRTMAKCQTFVNADEPSGTNIENFHAFPYVPGMGKVLHYPS
jgi:uncharacterized phage protein (TIGR02218 family)